MRINFYATLRAKAGGKTIEIIPKTASTVRSALEAATRDCPPLHAEIWKAPGELNEFIHVFVNGREARYLPQSMETALRTEDTLDVFPPVGGGSI